MTGINNIRRYVESRTAQPLIGIGDSVHRIHTGHEAEAEITFSDLRETLAVHDDLMKALEEIIDANTLVSDGGKVHDHGYCATVAMAALAKAKLG